MKRRKPTPTKRLKPLPAAHGYAAEPGPGQYRCGQCGGIFTKEWSDEEAKSEKERDFPGVPLECCVKICDNCYQKIRPDAHPDEYQAYKAERN